MSVRINPAHLQGQIVHYSTFPERTTRRGFLEICVRVGGASALSFMLPTEIFGGVETVTATGLDKKHEEMVKI